MKDFNGTRLRYENRTINTVGVSRGRAGAKMPNNAGDRSTNNNHILLKTTRFPRNLG